MSNRIMICLIFVSIFIGCDNQADFIPVLPEKKSDTTLVFLPDTVLVGSTLGIKYTIRDSFVSIFWLQQAEDFYAQSDSFDDGLTYFTVPFGPSSGVFLINQKVITPVLTINESYNHWGANVIWYNLDQPIPPRDTSIYEYGSNEPIPWQSNVNGDTITLNISFFDYPAYFRTMEIKFVNHGSNSLPEFVYYIRNDLDDTGQRYIDTLYSGMIKIQNWDTNDFIFGKAFFSVRKLSDYFTFYFNFKK